VGVVVEGVVVVPGVVDSGLVEGVVEGVVELGLVVLEPELVPVPLVEEPEP